MTRHGEDRITRAIALGKRYGAFDNPKGRAALRNWSVGHASDTAVSILLRLVKPLERLEALGELNPFGKATARAGELTVGVDPIAGRPVRMPVQDLRQGTLLAGNSGSGKSNLITWLLVQLAALNVRVLTCDLYKTQMRHLRGPFNRFGRSLVVLRPQDWKINFLDPGPCDPRAHMAQVVDLLVRVLGLPARSRNLLRHACHEEYRRFGVWEGRRDAFPNLYDVFEWIRRCEGINHAAREATLDRLGTLLTSLGPSVAAFRRGWHGTALAGHDVVFEMGGAPEFVKQLLLEFVLLGVMRHEIERGAPNAPLSLVIVFDDTQRLIDATSAAGSGEVAPLDELAGVVRGTGMGLCFAVQTMQGVSARLTPNLATKFFGRVGSGEDFRRLASEIALNREQVTWCRRNLQPGLFTGQLASGTPRDPFLVQVPLLNVPPTVTTTDVEESVRELDGLATKASPEHHRWSPFEEATIANSADPSGGLSGAELRFLRVVVAQPGLASSRYARLARMNGKNAGRIRRRLVDEGFLREHEVATKGRGRPSLVVEPLAKGIEAVRKDTEPVGGGLS